MRFGSPDAEITLQTDRVKYRIGDDIKINVEIRGLKDFEIDECRLFLYYVVNWTGVGGQRGTFHIVIPNGLKILAGKEHIGPSFNRRSEHNLEIPLDCPPSYSKDGENGILEIQWKLKITMDRKRQVDINEELDLIVVSAEESDSPSEVSSSFEEADLEAVLQRTNFREGDYIYGTILISPKQDFDIKNLIVELKRKVIFKPDKKRMALRGSKRTIKDGEQNISEDFDDSRKFIKDQAKEFPFTLPIKSTQKPSLRTLIGEWGKNDVKQNQIEDSGPEWIVSWTIEVKMDRRFKRDLTVIAPIRVQSV